MEFRFHPDALIELKAEVVYYEAARPGLGGDFADSVFKVIELACLFPDMGTPEGNGVRSLVTKRFPFVIFYEVYRDHVWIWAVMHGAREPGYWRTRRAN